MEELTLEEGIYLSDTLLQKRRRILKRTGYRETAMSIAMIHILMKLLPEGVKEDV